MRYTLGGVWSVMCAQSIVLWPEMIAWVGQGGCFTYTRSRELAPCPRTRYAFIHTIIQYIFMHVILCSLFPLLYSAALVLFRVWGCNAYCALATRCSKLLLSSSHNCFNGPCIYQLPSVPRAQRFWHIGWQRSHVFNDRTRSRTVQRTFII